MAYREVRTKKDPVLRQVAKPVKNFGSWLTRLLNDMEETMCLSDGVGLAAPQIGISKRIIVVTVDDETYRLVNPVIIEKEGEKEDIEGCLSVPEFLGKVVRAEKVKVEAVDENGEKVAIEAEGLLSVVLQHEIDHLDGILFTDKAKELYNNDPLPSVDSTELLVNNNNTNNGDN